LDVSNPELRRSYFRAPLTRRRRHVYPKIGPTSLPAHEGIFGRSLDFETS